MDLDLGKTAVPDPVANLHVALEGETALCYPSPLAAPLAVDTNRLPPPRTRQVRPPLAARPGDPGDHNTVALLPAQGRPTTLRVPKMQEVRDRPA